MSRIKVVKPNELIVHTPSFKEYKISGAELAQKYSDLGIEMPFPRSDNWYYHTDDVGAAKLIPFLVIKSSLYRPDRRDCDWYARKGYVLCCELFDLNTLLYTYGIMPLGPHGFSTWWVGDRFIIVELNEGFKDNKGEWRDIWEYLDGNIVFEWGENSYTPKAVLI
ncbi:hypothetical protein ES703_58102 [subsurface metagenome]